jgi:hypothetical protein
LSFISVFEKAVRLQDKTYRLKKDKYRQKFGQLYLESNESAFSSVTSMATAAKIALDIKTGMIIW